MVHHKPEPIDLGAMLRSEVTIIASQGYPGKIFEVTPQIAEHQQRFPGSSATASRVSGSRVSFPRQTAAALPAVAHAMHRHAAGWS